jgi:Ni/Co efflux regulator RcnB
MKRLALATLAALTFAGPLTAAGTAAADPPRHERGWDRDRGDRDYDNRDDRRDERQAYRQGYRSGQWDARQHNGYNYNGRWYYGPPPQSYYGRRDFSVGYRAWRRGDRLPAYYRSHYQRVDYRHERLRPPPRGYHYVRDDRGELLLVGVTTGIILGIIASGH